MSKKIFGVFIDIIALQGQVIVWQKCLWYSYDYKTKK